MQSCLKGEQSKVRKCLVKILRNNENLATLHTLGKLGHILYHMNRTALKIQIYKGKGNRKITFRPQHPRNWAAEPSEFPDNSSKSWALHIDVVATVFAFSFHGLLKEESILEKSST